jgi:protoporphyrinogen oxidase
LFTCRKRERQLRLTRWLDRVAGPSVVVLGGGLSGVAAAYTLARAGLSDVTIVESGSTLGGLAGSFEREGHFYPLGYHHILHRDRTLLFFLDLIGALPEVRWRRIRMLFQLQDQRYDLGSPGGFARFPMRVRDKARFVRLMLLAFAKRDWSDWEGRSAAELIDRWGGPGVRTALFESLTRLKFDLPCDQVSGAWLGARLHFREGSAPLGYIPRANWTKVLCDGVTRLLQEAGVRIRTQSRVKRLHTNEDRISKAELDSGEILEGDTFVSSIPTETYFRLISSDQTPDLESVRYTALLSVICVTRQAVQPDAYWINLASLDRTAGAIFLLSSLNPTIGRPGDTCVNFVTHLPSREHPLFKTSDEQLTALYLKDFRGVFGFDLEPFWTHVSRVPMYSPVFSRTFRNAPVRSTSWPNVYFAGNYRTFPSIVSTGTALGSGVTAASALLQSNGKSTELADAVARFRLRSMPRA